LRERVASEASRERAVAASRAVISLSPRASRGTLSRKRERGKESGVCAFYPQTQFIVVPVSRTTRGTM